jgi:hypothetical protein
VYRSPIHANKEFIMIPLRRTWFYRLSGKNFAHQITFKMPVSASRVREFLRQTVGVPCELWGRSAR